MPLVSIIVPVYNVELYLNRCVESLINQSEKNIEIILVDDGSRDNSGILCDEWGQKDSRIRVLHKVNGGLSDARNCGVNISNGEFISFVDSDDYVSDDYIKVLLSLAIENDADVSCCALKVVHDGNEKFIYNLVNNGSTVLNGKEASLAMFGPLNVQLVVGCGKLIRRDLVVRHPFPVGRLHEDEATTYKYIYESQYVAISPLELYAYFQNENSITHTRNDKNKEHIRQSFEEKAEYYLIKKERKLYAKTIHFMIGYFGQWKDDLSKKYCKDFAKKYICDFRVLFRTKIKIILNLLR